MSRSIQLFCKFNQKQKHYLLIQPLLKMRKNQAQHLDVIKKLSYFSVCIHQNLELTPLSGEILTSYISNHK